MRKTRRKYKKICKLLIFIQKQKKKKEGKEDKIINNIIIKI